jgi:hypothetical protein
MDLDARPKNHDCVVQKVPRYSLKKSVVQNIPRYYEKNLNAASRYMGILEDPPQLALGKPN